MGKVRRNAYVPDQQRADAYDALYAEYLQLHDHFGRGGNDVLHRLRAMRREAVARRTATVARRGAGVSGERGTHRELRAHVAGLHAELTRYGLVTWTAGNVSARVPGEDLFVIKGSGVSYDALSWEGITVCDLDGDVVDGVRAPSSDTAAHAYVYRNLPDVGGQVHTHSPYASAWAARGEEIPCVLTAMADEFGGPVPVGPFALIGDDSIGQGVVATLKNSRSPAVLMQNHGVFTVGPDAGPR